MNEPRGAMRLARPLMASAHAAPLARGVLLARRACSSRSAAAKQEYDQLASDLEQIKSSMRTLEQAHPEVMAPIIATDTSSDTFSPPKLHHINIVSREVSELLTFYRDVMRMDEMPIEMFPRNAASDQGGSDVPIRFTTDGAMQMHLATQDLTVPFRSGEAINPIGIGPVGHIAYRTDDIDAFKRHLEANGIAYSDYGTRFAKEWHQVFFLDPVGTIVEVHAVVS